MQLFGKFIDVNVKRTVTIEPPVMQNTSLLKDLFPYWCDVPYWSEWFHFHDMVKAFMKELPSNLGLG